jgi:hypothetical protein
VSALGTRVKTAKAVTVLLTGPVRAPRVADRRTIALWDPAVPDSRHPHHPALELPEAEAARVVARACAAARWASLGALRGLLEDLRERGARPGRIALVVASRTDPAAIANAHMRAHALEGRLFCDLLEEAARNCGLSSFVVTERELLGAAADTLGLAAAELPRRLVELGTALGPPWRADEKAAALGAWLALASAGPARE